MKTCKLWRSYTLLYAKTISFRSVAKRISAPAVVKALRHHFGGAAELQAPHLRHLDLGHIHSLQYKHLEPILAQYGAGIRSLNLCNCEGVNARVIQSIVAHCTTNLTKLDLTGCRKLTTEAFEPLFQNTALASSLKSLIVRGCYRADSDAFGQRLSESLTALEHLDLRGFGQATNKLLINVASNLTRLRHLEIQQYASPLDRHFIVALLSNCKQLEFLNAKQCKGTWNFAPDPRIKQPHLVTSRTLKVLELQHFSVLDDESLRGICNATREGLQELSVSDCPTLTDDGLSSVASLPHLRRLECKNLLQVSDSPFIEIVTSCHQLEILNVEGCALITDSLTKAICNNPSNSCRNKITINYSQCPLITDSSVLVRACLPGQFLSRRKSHIRKYHINYAVNCAALYKIAEFWPDQLPSHLNRSDSRAAPIPRRDIDESGGARLSKYLKFEGDS